MLTRSPGSLTPAPPGVRGRPRPPSRHPLPSPTQPPPPCPCGPPAPGAGQGPQRAPGRAADQAQSANRSGGPAQALPAPHRSRARPLLGRKGLPVPTHRARAIQRDPMGSHHEAKRTPQPSETVPGKGGGPTLTGLTCEFGPAARRAPWLPSGGGRRDPGARPALPRPFPPGTCCGAGQNPSLRSPGRQTGGALWMAILSMGRVSAGPFLLLDNKHHCLFPKQLQDLTF